MFCISVQDFLSCLKCGFYAFLVLLICKFIEWLIRRISVPDSELRRKYVFITGCDSGFGNLLAKRLANRGIHVLAACFTEKGAAELSNLGMPNVEVFMLDVTKHDEIVDCYEKVKKKLPKDTGLWGLVNNAGVTGFTGPLDWCSFYDFKKVIDVNLMGVIGVTMEFLPLIYKGNGRVVNISSAYGRTATTSGGYSEAKFGVESFSDSMRQHFKSIGVPCQVSILEPGYFVTPLTDKSHWRKTLHEHYKRLRPELKAMYPPGVQYINKVADATDRTVDNLLSPKLYKVVDAYEHALVSRYPKKRYACGWDARVMWVPLSYVPSCITDSFLTSQMDRRI